MDADNVTPVVGGKAPHYAGSTPPAPTAKSATGPSGESALPANLSITALRKMLAQAEQKEQYERREKHLQRLRPRRSTLVEELFGHYSLAPVEGDRNEVKRLAQLREKVLAGAPAPTEPYWHDANKSEVVPWRKDDSKSDELPS